MSKIPSRFYEFGRFRIDPRERLLWKEEEVVRLPPKVFAILLTLAENAPRIVEKNELLKAVWPNTFVEESNLSQNVFSLRKALGEPECIENIPKRRYRFIATVHRPEAVSTDRPAAGQKVRRAGLVAGAVALLTLAGGTLYLRYGHPRT
jgi:DNA-binding winged helix-turn-helix (wHTH) protein